MASKRQHSLPDQDIDEIRECILTDADAQGLVSDDDLFVDPYFPPDQGILNFVYSGDDKYEKMIFKRPKELCVSPNLCGVGGICHVKLPWRQSQSHDRHWFLYALATISLNPVYMEKVLPGHLAFEQSFSKSYCGAFIVQLWRFGEWVEVVIDDNLPVLDGTLAYCPLFGTPPELWGSLVEKAYAKSHRVYEAIETGYPTNALADLTGSICEHYSTDRASSRLFHILFKSCINRSLQVCWRHSRSLREAGFLSSAKGIASCTMETNDLINNKYESERNVTQSNQLFLITAVSKFPMRDGSLLEVIRLKDPYNRLCKLWSGEFSLGHASWSRVNPAFLENYRPKDSREPSEFWMSFSEFCVHFGDVMICSDVKPYRGIELDCERRYKDGATEDFTPLDSLQSFLSFEPSFSSRSRPVTAPKELQSRHGTNTNTFSSSLKRKSKKKNIEIMVSESKNTIKVDNVGCVMDSFTRKDSANRKCKGSEAKYVTSVEDECIRQTPLCSNMKNLYQYEKRVDKKNPEKTDPSSPFIGIDLCNDIDEGIHVNAGDFYPGHQPRLSGQSSGTDSNASSNTCMSDIKINLSHKDKSKVLQRARSAPIATRTGSVQSCSSQTSIFESRMDYFRSRGSWREIVRHFGKWKKSTAGGPRLNMQMHSKNPRIAFCISRGDSINEVTPAGMQGKAHILVSLLQDYRQGARNINGMLVSIGICLYKARSCDRDEKKSLSKLTLVDDVRSEGESREVTTRFDLEPGHYFLVPYTSEMGQTGEFLLRVIGEKDEMTGKTACTIS